MRISDWSSDVCSSDLLYQLVVSAWHQGRDRPLPVYGPPGTRRYVEGLMALWEPELALRIAHEKRPSTEALKVAVTEIAAGQALAFGALAVRVVEGDHQPVRPAFGFRTEERSVGEKG